MNKIRSESVSWVKKSILKIMPKIKIEMNNGTIFSEV
jgi:hypothetical protein